MNQLSRVSRDEMSLRVRTTQSLRTAILEGVFMPGQKLSERELCDQLGVSRPLLRESLQHLHAEGLINAVPHKSPEVTNISADEVRDIYEVRQSLESIAGRGFALNASDAQRAALRAKLQHMQDRIQEGDTVETLMAKNAFYEILIEGCGNAVAGQLLRQLNNRVTILRRISMGQAGRLPQMLTELDGIVNAIERRDGELAAQLCNDHVRIAAAYVFKHLEGLKAKKAD